MSSRITLNIGFYFEKQHYAQLNAYIPRSEALSIPQLNLEQRERDNNRQPEVLANQTRASRHVKSESKKESDD
jgi:hypothetical protein